MPIPLTPETPVTKSNALAAVVESIHEMAQALEAWAQFGLEVKLFFESEPGMTERFEAHRSARDRPETAADRVRRRIKRQR